MKVKIDEFNHNYEYEYDNESNIKDSLDHTYYAIIILDQSNLTFESFLKTYLSYFKGKNYYYVYVHDTHGVQEFLQRCKEEFSYLNGKIFFTTARLFNQTISFDEMNNANRGGFYALLRGNVEPSEEAAIELNQRPFLEDIVKEAKK